jgi:hypothetical protein
MFFYPKRLCKLTTYLFTGVFKRGLYPLFTLKGGGWEKIIRGWVPLKNLGLP